MKLRVTGREVRRRIAWAAVLGAIMVMVRCILCFVCRVMEGSQEAVM